MPQGRETTKMRMPRQTVRAGRGEAGYLGDVEVYDPTNPDPERTKRISGKQREPKENK